MGSDVTYFARTNFRNEGRLFGIRERDRFSHMYVVGKTGTGKSTLLKTMIAQDLAKGAGCGLLDPHGDFAGEAAALARSLGRGDDLIYLNTPEESWGFNPLARVPAERRSLVVAETVEVFRKLWSDDWGPRLEHVLRNVLFLLLEQEEATFGDLPRLFSDRAFRRSLLARSTNDGVKDYWTNEFTRYSPGFRAVVLAPLQNKVGAFLTDPRLKAILTTREGLISPREVVERGREPRAREER